MTYERRIVHRTTEDPTSVGSTRDTVVERTTEPSPSGGEMARRIIYLVFGIIQILIILRIGLLLFDAREGNDLVRFILDTSQLFVTPFIGIFNRDALHSGGSVLDIAAIAALVGWTVLEWILMWAMNLFRREAVV